MTTTGTKYCSDTSFARNYLVLIYVLGLLSFSYKTYWRWESRSSCSRSRSRGLCRWVLLEHCACVKYLLHNCPYLFCQSATLLISFGIDRWLDPKTESDPDELNSCLLLNNSAKCDQCVEQAITNLVVDNCADVPNECLIDGFVVVVVADQEFGKAPENCLGTHFFWMLCLFESPP